MAFVPFEPQPAAAEIPARLPSPFAGGEPHPLAKRAVALLQRRLSEAPASAEGKMFGVLVARDSRGRVGYLAGFSGMVDGRWSVAGFAPPLFDEAAHTAAWRSGEAELAALATQIDALRDGDEAAAARALAELDQRHDAILADLTARHRDNKRDRARQRDGDPAAALLEHLANASRADGAERRRVRAKLAAEREPIAHKLAAVREQRERLVAQRSVCSRGLLPQMQATYAVVNARGQRSCLADVFAPVAPPGGAGDCAAPKLLGHAYRTRLQPLALAEFWWGPPPLTGGRHHGAYYPACRGKCGPLLAFMLDGLDVERAPLFGADAIADDEPTTVFEDDWLVVVRKPAGLLSVPGRHDRLRDSVLTRLRRRYPEAADLALAHRLDLDTSGLLIAAKSRPIYTALQRQFSRREVTKRYIAWLAGDVRDDAGRVDLALRVDFHDRPRQIYDPTHGKPAITEWRVVDRRDGHTRVVLHPITGRSHQLRVHAAHPDGIGVPIVGDRLYGHGGDRLLLHAEALSFDHPETGEPVHIEAPAPF